MNYGRPDLVDRGYAVLGFGPKLLPAFEEGQRPWEFKCDSQLPIQLKGLLFECDRLKDIWVYELKVHKNSVFGSNNPVPATRLLEIGDQLELGTLNVGQAVHLWVANMGQNDLVFGGLFYGTFFR